MLDVLHEQYPHEVAFVHGEGHTRIGVLKLDAITPANDIDLKVEHRAFIEKRHSHLRIARGEYVDVNADKSELGNVIRDNAKNDLLED